MINNLTNKGIILAFITAIISGFAIFFNKFVIEFWSDASVFTTAKNLVAVLFLVSAVFLFGKWRELKLLSGKQWLRLVLIGLIGGSIPFLLFFKGLTMTSAVNAAFLHKTLFVWVAILAVVFLKEKISVLQWLAAGVLFFGVYLFSSPADFKIGWGEFLILLATLMWAIENVIAKKVLKNISSLAIGWGRMFFGSAFLLVYLLITANIGQLWVSNLPAGQAGIYSLGWLLLSGAILFGYVVTWYAALKRAPATVVSSVLVLAAPITAVLNSVFVTRQFNISLVAPTLLILLGIFFIVKLHGRFAVVREVRSAA